MKIGYTPSFFRQLKKLPEALQEETFEKITLFENKKNHLSLKVHKLKGRLSGKYSFSVNYQTRVVFIYHKNNAILISVSDHDIYK